MTTLCDPFPRLAGPGSVIGEASPVMVPALYRRLLCEAPMMVVAWWRWDRVSLSSVVRIPSPVSRLAMGTTALGGPCSDSTLAFVASAVRCMPEVSAPL